MEICHFRIQHLVFHRKLISRKYTRIFHRNEYNDYYFRYRKTNDEDDEDEFSRDKAEIVSDHDSDEIDYPDDEAENNDD